MPWQWISRIFNRAHTNELLDEKAACRGKFSPSQETSSNNYQPSSSHPQTSTNNRAEIDHTIKESSQALEAAFFAWLLECDEAALKISTEQAQQKAKVILKRLDQEVLSLDQLPRRPASFPLLIKLLNSDNASNSEIANTILSDPALATQTLKTANSPFFRTSNETIDSIERAVFILGIQGIRNIISATVMMPLIKGRNSREALFSKKVWQWGLLSATASDQLAHHQEASSGPVYLLGLLPALTYFLIYQGVQSQQQSNAEFSDLEPAIIKFLIQQRSWRLCHEICQQWGLPPSSNKYLLDAERPSPSNEIMPLRDGIFIGTHTALQSFSKSPIDNKQLHLLISAASRVCSKVIKHLYEQVDQV